jgi:hypothetical protein
MILVTALVMLGIATVGGAALWGGREAITRLMERRSRRKYLRWRSQWHLIKGGADGYSEQD